MSFLWNLQLLKEECCDFITETYQSIRERMTGSMVIALLSLAATAGSTVAAFLAWDVSRNASRVSEASQALALKVYTDQIALGHPSVSVLSGESTISAVQHRGYSLDDAYEYVAKLVLRNSGQRDSPRAWIALYGESSISDRPIVSVVTLPKETDVGVRFPLGTFFGVNENESSWLVAVIYEDEVPAPVISSDGSTASKTLHRVCAPPVVFRVTSWVKERGQDPAIRSFSSGSPVAAEQPPQTSQQWDPREETAQKIQAVKDEVIRAANTVNACMEGSP
ncbi:hypothetical protein NPS29_00975 [Pseudomonas putida]|uniref:hypothetical protein n=1 Tax=Pseudomonas putida TaxID=303 RepID=UPI00236419AD|nr:hypothetical protein [Pseudomonas putida]MDD1963882.1 hypothetical protein [Pseudomonas putida]